MATISLDTRFVLIYNPQVNSFIPFNPDSKYTEARVTDLTTGEVFKVIKGAPPVISNMCGGHKESVDGIIFFILIRSCHRTCYAWAPCSRSRPYN
jgi:magnesium-transporting ATPase (P-type)